MAKTRIDFGQDVLDLNRKKPTVLVHDFKVYRLKPFIARNGKNDPQEGFDLYVSAEIPRDGVNGIVNNRADHFSILASFGEIEKHKKYKLLKYFYIQTSNDQEAGLILRAVIARYLMLMCNYEVENIFLST